MTKTSGICVCQLVWNLNLGRASHLTSDLGKTNAFAMLINVSVEDSSTFFAREERSSTRKSQTFAATGSCLALSLFGKKINKRMTALNTIRSVCHFSVRYTEPVFFFFLWAFCVFFSARPRMFGEKKRDEKHRKKKAHGLNTKNYWR